MNLHIKIFGERNTGTNALKSMLESNSKNVVLPGTIWELAKAGNIEYADCTHITNKNKAGRKAEAQRAIDGIFKGRPAIEQWKHAATTFSDADIDQSAHYVILFREPLSWLLSLYKNPYHILGDKPESFNDFLDMKWEVLGRDNLPLKHYTPPTLYYAKLSSYTFFIHQLERLKLTYSVIPFESLILKQADCFKYLTRHLTEPSTTFKPLISSTKDSAKSLEFYQQHYGERLWLNEIDNVVLEKFKFDDKPLVFLQQHVPSELK